MQLYTRIGIIIAVLFTSIPTFGDDQNQPDSVSHLNGYTIGRALSTYYMNGDKEEFIRGLREGIGETDERSMSEDATRNAKLTWFNDTEISAKDKASYAAGYLSGDAYKEPISLYSASMFVQGLMDSLQSSGPRYVSKEQGTAIITQYQRTRFYKRKREVGDDIKVNERAGKAFLASNALVPGIVLTESGLQYRVISEGQGDHPSSGDTVAVLLVGRKIDGQVFYDSQTDGLGIPTTIKVNQTLDGWQEALVRMSPGAEWELYLPANLAYGNAGWQGLVEPGETLVYRLQLIEVIPAD